MNRSYAHEKDRGIRPPLPGRLTLAVFLASALLSGWISSIQAHAPHDVIELVAVSPNFATDRTVFAVIRLSDHDLLARSLDGGRSWLEYGAQPVGHGIKKLALSPDYANDGTLLAATGGGGIWRSVDFGLTWQAVNTGLTTDKTFDVALSADFAADKTALAATADGIFRSIDGGDTWTKVSSGLLEKNFTVVSFVPGDPASAYAGGKILHRSNDAGLTWAPLSTFSHELDRIAISPDFPSDGTMAVSLWRADGIFGSTDGGGTWAPANTGLTDLAVNDLIIADDGTVFAVTSTDGCFRADQLFASWTLFMEGFEKPSDQTEIHYRSVAASPIFSQDGSVFVGSFEGLFKSIDRGESWRQSDVYNQRLCRRLRPSPAYAQDRFLYVGNYGGGPFGMWGLGSGVAPAAPKFVPKGGGGGSGGTGKLPARPPKPGGFVPSPSIQWKALGDAIVSLHTSIICFSPAFAVDRTLYYAYMGLWRSTDAGDTWTRLLIPITIPRAFALSPAYAVDQTIYMGSGREGTYLSTDGGSTWLELQGGLPPKLRATSLRLSPMFPSDPLVYIASSENGVWRSPDAGATWVHASNGLLTENVRAMDISPDFATDGMLLAGTIGEGLFRSDDRGDTWVPVNDDFPSGSDNVIESIDISPDFAVDRTVFVASLYDGVFKSMDGGMTWQPAQAGLPPDAPREIEVSPDFAKDTTVFLSTHYWLWRSRDGGASWERLPGYNRVDDLHPAIFNAGKWETLPQPESFSQRVVSSDETDATHELEFRGDAIVWYAVKDADAGIAEVILDGQVVALVDLHSPATLTQQPVFSESFGGVDWHTIRIRVTGTKNPASTDALVKSDGFEYTF